jgi:hypothetical protein
MRGALALSARWPGWSDAGSLVVAIDPAAWAPPRALILVHGVVFKPKDELHVTVVGSKLGESVRAAVEDAAVARAFASQQWRLCRSGWRLRLRKEDKQSIVEPVALPAMARFHAWLGQRLGLTLPVPPPHVTLYVNGDPEGIGVPDGEACARYRLGPPWRAP